MESYEVVREAHRLEQVANEIHETSEVSLDLETVGFIPHRGKIRLCSINTGKGVYVIDMFETGTLGPVVDALRSTNAVKIGQNLKFDQRWLLHHENLELLRVFDTYRASALIHNGRKHLGNNLYDLYERELGIGPGTADLGGSNWAGPLSQEQLDYAAEDVIYLPRLREKLKPQLAKWGLNQTALIEFEAILPEASLENNGFRLDAEPWMALYRENAILANKLQAELLSELPHPAGQLGLPGMTPSFNIGSTQQLQKSLARLGLNVDSTNEDTLAMNAGKFPILKKLIEFKKVKKLCDAFGPDFLEHIDPQTERVHARFFPFTGAGRYSCSAPWTPVRTSVGVKPLESVVPGDFVWTHKQRWRRVVAFLPQGNREVFDVRFNDGQVLTCTADHRVLLCDGRWVTIEELQSSATHAHSCALYVGEGQPVRTVDTIDPCGSLEVYDLTVEEDESFETCGIFSHNCSNPNLQQIPRLKAFRGCFRPGLGRKLIVNDYSQVELRLAAEISGDATMIAAYKRGEDIHSLTAALINQVDLSEVTKAMRQMAKAVNFGLCIAAGQRVLTSEGLLPIECVKGWHLLWDGVEWVSHSGVIFQGYREVLEYEGLVATPDHEVFTDDCNKLRLAEAAGSSGIRRLAIGGIGDTPTRYLGPNGGCPDSRSIPSGDASLLFSLSGVPLDLGGKHPSGQDSRMFVPSEHEVRGRSESAHPRRSLRCNDSALSEGYPCLLPPLQGSGDRGSVRVSRGFHTMGACDLSGEQLQEAGLRSDQQQRALRTQQFETNDLLSKYTKQGLLTPVYDILNAGPRRRFVVEGKVVSNCYGMGAEKLVIYAQTSYNVTMTVAQAQSFRKRYFEAYSGIATWHRRALHEGKAKKMVRTLSGRLRWIEDEKAHSEFLNTPVQGSGADGLKRALRNVYERLKKYDGKVFLTHMVHDEIVLDSVDDSEILAAAQLDLKEGMDEGIAPFLKRVVGESEGGVGDSWADK